MKKRVAYFIIDGKQFGGKNGLPLNITFDISYMGNSLVPLDAKFTIDNLKADDVAYISTNTALFQNRRRKIEFYCGYEGNVRRLFDGEILEAVPHGQPDTSLEIKAWTSIYSMGKKIKITGKNVKLLELLRDAVKENGYELDCPASLQNSSQLQKVISDFSFTGSAMEYLFYVIRAITGSVIVKDQIMFIIQNQMVSVAWATKKNKTPNTNMLNTNVQINASTGMIGIPEPTQCGVNIRTILDVSLNVGQTIDFLSSKIPIYNGEYNIYGLNYHGCTRSNDYYNDLICLRVMES